MLELKVCIGSACHIKGSYNVITTFQQMIEEYALHRMVELKAGFCTEECKQDVSVWFNDQHYSISPENARSFFKEVILPSALK